MKTKNSLLPFALPAALLCAARLWEVLSGRIEPNSGYLKYGMRWYHYAAIVLIAGACILCARRFKSIVPPRSYEIKAGSAVGTFAALSALGALAASAVDAAAILSEHSLSHLFMTRSQLAALGYYSTGFRISLLSDIFGAAAAVYLMLFALCVLGRHVFYDNLALSMALPVWLCLRAVARFATGFVNSHDTVTVAAVVGCMILANTSVAAERFISTDDSAKSARTLITLSLLSLYLCCGLLAPCVLRRMADGETSSAIFYAAIALISIFTALLSGDIIAAVPNNIESGNNDGNNNSPGGTEEEK